MTTSAVGEQLVERQPAGAELRLDLGRRGVALG